MNTNGNGYAPGSGTIMGAMSEFNPQAKAPAADIKREAVNQELTGGSGFLVPHHRTFLSVLNAFSRIYSYRYDEAIRRSRSDALALKRDVYIRALMQERIYPLGRWKWEIESDPDDVAEALAKNPKDPMSVERENVRRHLQAVAARTPRLKRMIRSLGWADWYGKQGCQLSFGQDQIAGELRKVVKGYRPVEGDKILYDFDGVPGIVLQMGTLIPHATVRYTDLGMPVLLLDRPEFRERVIIHTYDLDDADITEALMGGRIHGVGIRDAVAWACELRLEMMSWIMDFMEKVGNLGILIFYYEEGNPAAKTAAENSAKNASGRNALAVPVPRGGDKKTAGVDILPANMTGVQFLLSCVTDWFERHIERMIVGQSMSGGKDSGDGLGGTGRAEFAKDTKMVLLASDAEDMGETLTADFVKPLKEANFSSAPWRYTWQFRVPDPNADKILDAIGKAANMPGKKLTFKADEVRQLVGLTKPDDGDDVVGGDEVIPIDPNRPQPMPGQPMPATGQPGGQAENVGGQATGQPDPAGGAGDGGKADAPADVPGMGELVAAMFQAAEAEDWDAVDRLAELGVDPSALAGLIDDDDEAEPEVVAYQRSSILPYQWSQGTTRSGHIKAVWSGDGGAKKPLYGQAAERALANQGKRDRGEEILHPSTVAKQKREPERQAAREVWKEAAADPTKVQPEQLMELADQLKKLTRDELRDKAKEIGRRVGGLKDNLVQRFLDHVQGKESKKESTKASTGESLAAVVQSYGGIDPNDSELKAHFSNMKEALEYGFTIGMFKKGGAGLDQMASTLEAAGHITTPDGKLNTQHLVDQLAKKARSDLFDTTKEVESALDNYYRELSEATGGTNDYTPGDLGDEWASPTTDRPEVVEAVRSGKEAGEREAQAELSTEGGGSTDFNFGHNAEPVTAGDNQSELPDSAILSRGTAQSFSALQRSLGIKKPTLGTSGMDQIRANLAKRPGGRAIAALLTADTDELHEAGYPNLQGDTVTAAIDGKFTGPELLDAAAWASAFDVRDGADRFLYGAIKAAKTSDGSVVSPDGFARIQQAEKLRKLAEQHGDKDVRKEIMSQANALTKTAMKNADIAPKDNAEPVSEPDPVPNKAGDNPPSPLDSVPADRHSTGTGGGQSADPKPEGGTMKRGSLNLADHAGVRDAVHEAVAGIDDPFGQSSSVKAGRAWDSHKVLYGDLYEAMKDRLPPGTTLDQFKAAVRGNPHLETSRIDLPQVVKPKGGRIGAERLTDSAHPHTGGETHAVTITGDKLGAIPKSPPSVGNNPGVGSQSSALKLEGGTMTSHIENRQPKFDGPAFFHGTNSDVAAFDGRPTSFTSTEGHARNFGSNVHKVQLDVRNPIDLTHLGSGAGEAGTTDERVSGQQIMDALVAHGISVPIDPNRKGWTSDILRHHLPEIFRQGQEKGFDGLKLGDFKDFEADELMPFSPKQIKVHQPEGTKGKKKDKAAFVDELRGASSPDSAYELIDAAAAGKYGDEAKQVAEKNKGWGYTPRMIERVRAAIGG